MADRQENCGAMWKKQDRNGKDYFFIVITVGDQKMNFNAFENSYKREQKHPDYKIFVPNITRDQYKPWGGHSGSSSTPPPDALSDEGEVPF